VVPVYRGLEQTMACLGSVLDTVPDGTRIIVVDDASPEPALAEAVRTLAQSTRVSKRVRLIRHEQNQGFPAAANSGLRAAGRRDAVLLNSDTIVPPGWIERLREAAYAAPDTGSATPLSNDATLASYPEPLSPAPDIERTRVLDRIARRANGALTVEVPTGVGFCLYMRRDCIDEAGLFRDLVFAQGYGEENDWCLRARALGWRHVVAAGVFVAHVGGQSFGPAREHLMRRNLAALNRLHPGYDALIADFGAADPLASARRRMDALRWRAAGRSTSAILMMHEGGGGVDRVIAQRSALLRAGGQRPVVLSARDGQCHVTDGEGHYPNLHYRLPRDLPRLTRLLRADQPTHVELHHLLGHNPAILDLSARLQIPYDAYIHDYAWFCPRISLMSYGRRYCGEPDVAGCEACVADLGSRLDEPISVRDLLARSARVLAGARRVVAPSDDAARRLARHFAGVRPVVEPWERDPAPARPAIPRGTVRRVAVVGAIGTQKGYDLLLACVRDARARRLPVEFVVVGHTADDARLLDAGPVFITGRYDDAEAVSLIRAQGADLAFMPSIWPETWCFALTRTWEAGLSVAAFDIGAQAERIRRTGRGWLLPLGLPASRVNAALLGLPQNVATPLALGALPLHSRGQDFTARIL
jgi:GT2 family glycosyltransferase/glycosyltransferase involved in cell wall biosynthesis